jgi:hypothetical protein
MAKYIQANAHTIVGNTGSPSATLAPGEQVPLTDSVSHKYLAEQIKEGNPDYAHLSIVEVSQDDLKAAEEEKRQQLEQAEKIAAEVPQEGTGDTEGLEGEPSVTSTQTNYPPQDREAQRLADESGAGQRATTQEDVAEEDKQASSRSRSTRRSRSQ